MHVLNTRAIGFTLAVALALLTAGHMLYAVMRISFSIVLPDIMRTIGIPLGLAGLIANAFGLGQALSGIPGGWILQRKGPKFSLSLGILTMTAANFLTGLATFALDMLAYRVLLGVGQGVWNVAYVRTVGGLFPRRRALSITLFSGNYTLGMAWGAPLTGYLYVIAQDWRFPFYVIAFAGLALSAAIFAFLKSSALTPREESLRVPSKSFQPSVSHRDPSYWATIKMRNVGLLCLIGLVWGLLAHGLIALYPTYLREVGRFDPVTTGLVTSMMFWLPFATSMLTSVLSDKFGRKWLLLYEGLATSVVVYFMFRLPSESLWFASAATIIYGLAQGGGYSIINSFMLDSVNGSRAGAAVGFLNSFMFLGSGFSAMIFGYFISIWGWATASYWLMALAVAFVAIATLTQETVAPHLSE